MEDLQTTNEYQMLDTEVTDLAAEAYVSPQENVVSIIASEVTLGSEGDNKDSRTSPRRSDGVLL